MLPERAVNGISRRAACAGVLACVILALVLRLAGLEARLPHGLEPDGSVIASQVEQIRKPEADRTRDGTWALYPHLIAHVAALLPARERGGDTLEDHLEQASAPFVRVRLVCGLLSVLAIPASYALARRFLARGPALLVCLLSAASLLSTLISPQARPHGPAASLLLLAIVAALRLRRRPNWGSCALAGLALGLAVSTLQSGIAAVLPMAAAWCWRAPGATSRALRWLGPLLLLALAGAIAWTLYPHTSAVPQQVADLAPESAWFAGGHQIQLGHIDGSGFLMVARTLISFETLPFVLALGAIVIALPRLRRGLPRTDRARDGLVCAAYALPYLFAIGMYGWTVERFCLPLVPFVACLAAAAWVWCAARLARPIALLLLLLLVVPQLQASARLAWLRCQPDGATSMARWIEANSLDAQERVLLVPALDLPLARSDEALDADAQIAYGSPWISYQRSHRYEAWDCKRYTLGYMPLHKAAALAAAARDPIGTARGSNAQLVALAAPDRERGHPTAAAFREALLRDADLVHRSPAIRGEPANELTLGYDFGFEGRAIWTWELLTGSMLPGRIIELYRLR